MKIERCKYNKKTKPDVVSVLDEKKKVVREIDLPAYLEAPGKREQFLCVSKPRWGYFEHAFTAYITRHLIRHRTLGTIACYCVHNPDHHITLELTQLKEFYVLTLD